MKKKTKHELLSELIKEHFPNLKFELWFEDLPSRWMIDINGEWFFLGKNYELAKIEIERDYLLRRIRFGKAMKELSENKDLPTIGEATIKNLPL